MTEMLAREGATFAFQDQLPKLPIPPLEDTCNRYLRALEGLQDPEEHGTTKEAVKEFLEAEGPTIQEQLKDYAKDKASYIEEFWYRSYLSHSDPVVLALNPFFVLENDPMPDRGSQLPRAASLIVSSLGFIHDLRNGIIEPDTMRGTPLDMDQYSRLFGTARIPTANGCRMQVTPDSRHIVVLRRGQFYWFDCLDEQHRPTLTEADVIRNLKAILDDEAETPFDPTTTVGVLSTENRKVWSSLRAKLSADPKNHKCLEVIDQALFVVCLDDDSPKDINELCDNYLCGTYRLEGGVQVGTCINRWYDKLQIIVCPAGSAGINFEHTGVDGHTVLRYAADVFTEGLMLLARSINPAAPTLFHAPKPKPSRNSNGMHHGKWHPKKLVWNLPPALPVAIRYAETRLSDLICQNDCRALEFKTYGKNFITQMGFSPDAFVQMAFQVAWSGLYGRIECVYEPAMTKAFLHGRTEAIRSVQKESVEFTEMYHSHDATPQQKVAALRKACERHVKLTKECSQGLGQDRHLYALYCLFQQLHPHAALPSIFRDPGWELLSTSILSTSNCGNPALRLFGFGPVSADGYGIGYIIKDGGISICASSKHLQTARFLNTLETYLKDVQRLLRQVNQQRASVPEPLDEEDEEVDGMHGYSFFGDVDVSLRRKKRDPTEQVGKTLRLAEY